MSIYWVTPFKVYTNFVVHILVYYSFQMLILTIQTEFTTPEDMQNNIFIYLKLAQFKKNIFLNSFNLNFKSACCICIAIYADFLKTFCQKQFLANKDIFF